MRTRVLHYWGPSHRQDGASLYLYHAMRRFPRLWCEHYELEGLPPDHGKRSLSIEVDWAGDCFGKNEYRLPHPNFYWVSDSHFSSDSFKARMERAKLFGIVATNIRDHVEMFRRQGPRAFWLPYAAEPTVWQPIDVEREYDWAFIGHLANYPDREDFCNKLSAAFPNCTAGRAFFEDANAIANSARIAVNHTMTDYSTNMRVFEMMCTGRPLLTRHTNDLKDMGFVDGEDLITFKTFDECADKMKHYLAHPDEAEKIGARGRERILAEHTYLHRAIAILQECGLWETVADITPKMVAEWNAPKDPRKVRDELMAKQRGEK